MIKKITTLAMVSVFALMADTVSAQWTAVNNGLPATTSKGVANVNGVLYTAIKGHGIYTSNNNGDTWQKWARSSELPNTNYTSFVGNEFDMSGEGSVYFSVTGDNLFAVYEDQGSNQNSLSIVPLPGLTGSSAIVNAWSKNDGEDIMIVATNGGVHYKSNSSGTFTKSTGITQEKINALQIAGDDNQYTFVGTDKGVFRSSDNGKTFSAYNQGFATPLRINRMSGLFTLTERGVYINNNTIGSFVELTNTGESRTKNISDYKAYVFSPSNGKVYFFGKNAGTELDFYVTFEMTELSLNGITDSSNIIGTTIIGNYLFVSTETGGVFRMALDGGLGIADFNQAPEAQFTVSPNPSTGEFKITSEKPVSVQLLDLTGKLIQTYSVNESADIKENLTPGLYILKDATNGGAKKLIIK